MLIFIGVMTSGCVNNDIGITFDDKDNMIVTSSIKYADENKEYLEHIDLSYDKLKPAFEIKAKSLDTDIQNEQYSGGYSGFKQTQICHHISKAKDIREISILKPLEGKVNVLEIKNFLIFKKYILEGRILATSEIQQNMKEDIDLFLKTKFDISIPTHAIKVKTNAWSVQGNHYMWEPRYLVYSPLLLEFSIINWLAIISIVFVLVGLVYYCLVKNRKWSFDWRKTLSKIARSLDSISAQTETTNVKTNEMHDSMSVDKTESIPMPAKSEQSSRRKPQTKRSILIIVALVVILLGGVFYFSIPKICETLISNSIQNIYSGNVEKAIQLVELAKKLSPDEDYSKDIYSKGIDEFNKNNMSNAEAFMKMTLKLDSKQAKDFSRELTDKSISALDSKQNAKAKKLMEYALKFDVEIPNKKRGDILQKCINLSLAKKFEESLPYSDMLILLNAKDVEGYTKKGIALYNLNKGKEAVEAFTKAINIKNNHTMAYLSRGNVYLHSLKDYDKALYDFNKVISLSQTQGELGLARYGLAQIYGERKQYRKAMNEAWIAKDIFYSIGNVAMANESQKLFDLAAEYECMYGGYCY